VGGIPAHQDTALDESFHHRGVELPETDGEDLRIEILDSGG
jgi:hypothetical protein